MSKYYNEIEHEDSLDMASPIESKWYSCERCTLIALQLQFTGTPTGTFTVQGAIEKEDPIDLVFPEGVIQASGAAGTHEITISEYPYTWLRFVYAPTSGAGELSFNLNRKGF